MEYGIIFAMFCLFGYTTNKNIESIEKPSIEFEHFYVGEQEFIIINER